MTVSVKKGNTFVDASDISDEAMVLFREFLRKNLIKPVGIPTEFPGRYSAFFVADAANLVEDFLADLQKQEPGNQRRLIPLRLVA